VVWCVSGPPPGGDLAELNRFLIPPSLFPTFVLPALGFKCLVDEAVGFFAEEEASVVLALQSVSF
jgi:hypothetical protein